MSAWFRSSWGWLAGYGALLALLWAATAVLREGPDPASLEFDTTRAFETARALIPDNQPHPTGSAENAQVARRVTAMLNDYGYDVSRQREFLCTDFSPGCTQLENLVAVKPGRLPGGDAILLTAHYDSAPGAPGAGDDIAGVAALLEVARLLAAGPPLRNDIVFLIADAEETGLRGAMAFAERHPLMQRIRLVVNLEARGVTGPSLMFETSDGNAPLIDLFAASASRPVSTSLMYEVYRRMPNNTDFTIYKDSDAPDRLLGLNFAFARGVALYHSSRDDLERLNPASLGHHGDNVLHFARLAGNTDLASLRTEENASYVDLFGRHLLHWPAALNLPAALAALLLVLAAGHSVGALRPKAAALSLLWIALLIVAHLLSGWLLSWPLGRWPGIHALDHPQPGAGNLALFGASVLLVLLFGAAARRRPGPTAFLFGCWTVGATLACLLAWTLPGAAYMALLPAAVFALMAAIERLLRPGAFPTIAAWAGLAVAAWMAVYHYVFMDVLTSFTSAWLKTAALCLGALAAAPLAAHHARHGGVRGPLALTAAVTAAAIVAGFLADPYTPDRPRSVNVVYQQFQYNGAGFSDAETQLHSAWRLFTYGPPDVDHARRAGFSGDPATFHRWGLRESQAYLREIPSLGLPPPILHIDSDRVENDRRVLRGTLRAGRNGFLLGLTFPPGVVLHELTVEDTTILHADNYAADKGVAATFSGLGERPLAIELTVPIETPFDVVAFELSAFPDHPDGAAIIRLRPDDAAAIQFADHTEIQHHYRF
jgi:hypothetical protein